MSVLVVVICAPRDEAMCDELVTHLGVLQDAGSLQIWTSRNILPGEDRSSAAHEQIERADIVVALLSAEFVHWEEKQPHVQRALERSAEGSCRLIPVRLRPCIMADSPLARLQVLPRDGRPVTMWDNRDDAWVQIAEALRAIPDAPTGASALPEFLRPRRMSEAERSVLELETQLARRRAMVERGSNPHALDDRIRDLKRTLREGGQLHSGDSLDVDRYFLLRQLGYGGFATVWEAEDRQRGRRVAVKVLHPQLAGKLEFRSRFIRGARVMAGLKHPAIVKILQPPLEDVGFIYFVMELLPKGDLHRAVLQGRILRSDVAPLLRRVGEALTMAHERGHVHRDVSPHNILLDATGEAKLTDFDLVAASGTQNNTHSGAVLGKLIYAPPEVQENPHEADERADVYGLGMTGVFCYYGRELPRTVLVDRDRILKGIESTAVADVLRVAIEPDRRKRFATVRDFCKALHDAVEDGRSPPSVLVVDVHRDEADTRTVTPTSDHEGQATEVDAPSRRLLTSAALAVPPPPVAEMLSPTPPALPPLPSSGGPPHPVSLLPGPPARPPSHALRSAVDHSAEEGSEDPFVGAHISVYARAAGPTALLLTVAAMVPGMMPAAGRLLERAPPSFITVTTMLLFLGLVAAGRSLRGLSGRPGMIACSVLAVLALLTGLALTLLVVEGRAYVQMQISGDPWRIGSARREAYHAVLETWVLWPLGTVVGYGVFWLGQKASRSVRT